MSEDNSIIITKKNDLKEIIQEIVLNTIENNFQKEKEERFLTISQTCERLGVTKATLWRWHKEKKLVKVYIGDSPRYRESDIIKMAEGI